MTIILGVTGYLASGKDTVADYLRNELGFLHISLSDILREDLKNMGKEVTRTSLQELGNEIRTKFGGGILAERALGRRLPNKNYVITSIGRVDEVKALKKNPNFKLIFVTAPQKKRFEWIQKRQREEDPQTFKEFIKHEQKESRGGGAQYREFDNLKKISDIIINNNSTIENFHKKINRLAKDVDKRPNWDDYFFGIMEAVAKRATCDRGKTAALIVRDNMILATGYVGAPRGLPSCDEIGHLMEETIHADGVARGHCVRTTHAEQNAIAQAAKHGIRIEGAKMYTKMAPCLHCAKMIINSGIVEVICQKGYHAGNIAEQFLRESGIKIIIKDKEVVKYSKQ